MKIVEIAEATAALAGYTSELADQPVIITSNGQPIAALVTLENIDFETISLRVIQNFLS
ncbi:type II toxin-antitoxin system prevent-host-death family antitoxin [Nostoc sp. UHCC 0702]|nr:type II toxin-antitoxin system prevent-host-death family antitoxin [Nostoc sp. UHCC 0702]